MSEQPSQELPKEQGSQGRDNAAAKKAAADQRKADREAAKQQPEVDNTLPEDLNK
jgi:hypothetical protein